MHLIANALRLLLLLPLFSTLTACSMNDLPRNQNLKAFDPHRKDFVCRHEADVVPPIDTEAEQWFQQGLAVTSRTLWPDQRDYKKAADLWTQAAERKHWKAMLNLAGLYVDGTGVPRDTERAVQIVEQAMKLGIPAAYDLMGTYHMNGTGVKQDASRAYAFWERAADKGSSSAQAYLGKALDAAYSNPKEGFWGNRPVGRKMLECSYAQGNGEGAFELGLTLDVTDHDYAGALKAFHDGAKFGSNKSAAYLGGAFRAGEPLVGNIPDKSRGDRYSELADALRHNPDLRFPNLDKVLPLPPAPLPKWDGNKQTLIDAAKAVVPVAPPPSTPAATPQRTGRAYIPEGQALPGEPQFPVPAQYESTAAPESGYWIARLTHPRTDRHLAWNAAQLPMRYDKGELFDRRREGLEPSDGRLQFHYLGMPVAQAALPPLPLDLRVAQGIAREAERPMPELRCSGDTVCPATGIWAAHVADDHPLAAVFNQWHRQSYVIAGQPFPDPRSTPLNVDPGAITWIWWGQANHEQPAGVTHVGVQAPLKPFV